ncbi:hypothetical protein [Rhodococcus sp. WWJCD1]|uniref:hypothetical protein n=1 Tax=Rhodococcus sp. WWJCD1 TaxID=2022519 RepID=UPI0011403485|nr:hypothetical protein [Rhodococcus sp. WWJCD1]
MWLIVYIAFLLWLVASTVLAVRMGTAISRSSLEDEAAELRRLFGRAAREPHNTDIPETAADSTIVAPRLSSSDPLGKHRPTRAIRRHDGQAAPGAPNGH